MEGHIETSFGFKTDTAQQVVRRRKNNQGGGGELVAEPNIFVTTTVKFPI